MRIGRFITAAFATLWMTVGGLTAEPAPVVVELYTSQGCSSCPPADKLLHKLAERPGVIALALHVDYWDYIGWKDEFASPAHTKRQKVYARVAGNRTIYTPQMVIAGQDHVIGARPMEVMDLLAAHKSQAAVVTLTLVREGARLRIAAPSPETPAPMVVELVRFTPEATVDIRRGENAGRKLRYVNIVTDWSTVAEWSGAADLELDLEAGEGPVAVIVQAAGQGPILGAAKLP